MRRLFMATVLAAGSLMCFSDARAQGFLDVRATSVNGGDASADALLGGAGNVMLESYADGPGSRASNNFHGVSVNGGFLRVNQLSIATGGGTSRVDGRWEATDGGYTSGNLTGVEHGGSVDVSGRGSANGPYATTELWGNGHATNGGVGIVRVGGTSEGYWAPAAVFGGAVANGLNGGWAGANSNGNAISQPGLPARADSTAMDYANGAYPRLSPVNVWANANSFGGKANAKAVRCR